MVTIKVINDGPGLKEQFDLPLPLSPDMFRINLCPVGSLPIERSESALSVNKRTNFVRLAERTSMGQVEMDPQRKRIVKPKGAIDIFQGPVSRHEDRRDRDDPILAGPQNAGADPLGEPKIISIDDKVCTHAPKISSFRG